MLKNGTWEDCLLEKKGGSKKKGRLKLKGEEKKTPLRKKEDASKNKGQKTAEW